MRFLAAIALLTTLLPACSRDEPRTDEDEVSAGEAIAGHAGEANPNARYRPARDGGARTLDDKIEALEGVGYLTGSKKASMRGGVTVHDGDRVDEGLNLLTSGHAPAAILMTNDGKIRHRWRCPFDKAFPDFPAEKLSRYQFGDYFRRVRLLDDGALLAIFEGQAMVKIDRNSNVLWAFDGMAHHDLDLDDEGRIWTLTRQAHVVPAIHPSEPILEDFVTRLSAAGKPEVRFSILRAFMKSKHRDALRGMPKEGDVLHTNTIEVLDGSLADRIPAFAAGNLLISCLMIDTIAVIDPAKKAVVWTAKRDWVKQHQPTVLANGNILLFDNLGGETRRGRSRAIELDPVTMATVWKYVGAPDRPFETETCGSGQRLPNGNTLLTESDNGRAFEVTPQHEIVWEWVNPNRAGEQHEYIATLFEMIRLPADAPLGWLDE